MVAESPTSTWKHQNAYRRKRYLEQTMQRTLIAERARNNAKGRPGCWAERGVDGRRCPNSPVPGTNVCRFHGGSSPQAKRLAAIRVGYLKAREVVEKMVDEARRTTQSPKTTPEDKGKLNTFLDRAVKRDPREVLLQQVHEAAAMAAATREMAGDIDVGALQDPEAAGHAKAQQVHDLFETWNTAAIKASKAALDIGIDEAMIRLAELQAKAMVHALKAVLQADVLQLTSGQQKLASALLGKELRRLVPEVEEAQTWTLNVDGEEMPYNQAMDNYMRHDVIAPAAQAEYRHAHKARTRERARLGPELEPTGTE